MRNAFVIICVSFLLSGCSSIIASSSPYYFYKNNAYVRSTSDIRKARVLAQGVCQKALNKSSRASYGHSSELISYPEKYHKDGNAIVFSCETIDVKQSLLIRSNLEERVKSGDGKAREDLEDYNRMFPTSNSGVTCFTSGGDKVFSINCF